MAKRRRPAKQEPRATAGDHPIAGTRFVFSHTYDDLLGDLKDALTRGGAKLLKTLSRRVNYFVQNNDDDDDDRLAQARRLGVQVVPVAFVAAGIENGGVLPSWRHFAVHGGPGVPPTDAPLYAVDDPRVTALFPPVIDSVREIEECPQCVCEFVAMDRVAPSACNNTFAVVPIVSSRPGSHGWAPSWSAKDAKALGGASRLAKILPVVSAFFNGMDGSVLDPVQLDVQPESLANGSVDLIFGAYAYPIRARALPDGSAALHAMDLIAVLDENIPDGAFCLVGLLVDTLYEAEDDDPDVSGSTVLGRATGNGSAVVCAPRGVGAPAALKEFVETFVHESSHMWGLDHCAFFRCTMNAYISTDAAAPAHDLCPICVRKLEIAIPGFDIADRYASLATAWAKLGMQDAAAWASAASDFVADS